MNKVLVVILVLIFLCPAAFSAPKKMIPAASGGENQLPHIFIYTIPDEDLKPNVEEDKDASENEYTTPVSEDEEITLDDDLDNVIIGATVLKGYAQYIEDSDTVYLKDANNDFVLNLKTPQKISATKGLNLSTNAVKPTLRYTDAEYLIAPNSINTSTKFGNLTIGANFNNEVDNNAMLETETGLFTRYEKNRFALSSSVTKSLNTTNAQDYNTVSLTPELKINNYLSLKNVMSADVTRNRQSSKLVLSINPFGKKDQDRFLLELGAKETYYAETENTTTQFSFSTKFKL